MINNAYIYAKSYNRSTDIPNLVYSSKQDLNYIDKKLRAYENYIKWWRKKED